MPDFYYDLVQGSVEWFEKRLGRVTSSEISPLMAQRGLGKGAETYAVKIATEQITGVLPRGFKNKATEHGNTFESEAIAHYEITKWDQVTPCGGCLKNDIWSSTDGIVGENGIVEVKSLYVGSNHGQALYYKESPSKYKAQIQTGLAVTERDWCDYISFDPSFPGSLKIYIQRVYRDEPYIKLIWERHKMFLDLVEEVKIKIQSK